MICCVRAAKAVQTPARYKRKAVKYAAVKDSHDREQNAVFDAGDFKICVLYAQVMPYEPTPKHRHRQDTKSTKIQKYKNQKRAELCSARFCIWRVCVKTRESICTFWSDVRVILTL